MGFANRSRLTFNNQNLLKKVVDTVENSIHSEISIICVQKCCLQLIDPFVHLGIASQQQILFLWKSLYGWDQGGFQQVQQSPVLELPAPGCFKLLTIPVTLMHTLQLHPWSWYPIRRSYSCNSTKLVITYTLFFYKNNFIRTSSLNLSLKLRTFYMLRWS